VVKPHHVYPSFRQAQGNLRRVCFVLEAGVGGHVDAPEPDALRADVEMSICAHVYMSELPRRAMQEDTHVRDACWSNVPGHHKGEKVILSKHTACHQPKSSEKTYLAHDSSPPIVKVSSAKS